MNTFFRRQLAPFFMGEFYGNLGRCDYAIFNHGSAGQYPGVFVSVEKRPRVQTTESSGSRVTDRLGDYVGFLVLWPCATKSTQPIPGGSLDRWRSGIDDHCDPNDFPFSRRSDGRG